MGEGAEDDCLVHTSSTTLLLVSVVLFELVEDHGGDIRTFNDDEDDFGRVLSCCLQQDVLATCDLGATKEFTVSNWKKALLRTRQQDATANVDVGEGIFVFACEQ